MLVAHLTPDVPKRGRRGPLVQHEECIDTLHGVDRLEGDLPDPAGPDPDHPQGAGHGGRDAIRGSGTSRRAMACVGRIRLSANTTDALLPNAYSGFGFDASAASTMTFAIRLDGEALVLVAAGGRGDES